MNEPIETRGNADLFGYAGKKRGRRPNMNKDHTPPGIVMQFLPEEFTILKFNHPGPSGVIGGLQRMENILIEVTDETTLVCPLNAQHLERLIRYLKSYGDGGPNGRLRRACTPALARIGIYITPDWQPEGR